MSAQRAVSPTRPPFTPGRLIATLTVGAALGVAASTLLRGGLSDVSVVTLQSATPGGSHKAFVVERPCAGRKCQVLYLGQVEKGTELDTLEAQSSASEIAWTPDGKRVGFLVDGRELRLYDTTTRKLAGRVGLLTNEAATTRLARGITFSDNGRAVTFDDCPKKQSGCRPAFLGVPQ
jgi:hypothetical protein